MANPEHVKIVKQGRGELIYWRMKNPIVRIDLSGTDLSGANLPWVVLIDADLRNANLSGAGLSGANLSGADLLGVDLTKTDLSHSNLIGTNLHKAKLEDACLDNAAMGSTILADVDLSKIKGLESVRHHVPSSIDTDTLYKSQGKIPEEFLRGCGVPDELIAYLPSLLGAKQAIEFYSCFISYSHKDEEFAQRLFSRMRDKHLRVWYAPEDMKAGQKIHEQIEQAIRLHDKLLLVLSETSLTSEWVQTEIYHARQREQREGRRVLFPIRLVPFERLRDWKAFDADTGRDMAREIREYFIPDFSNWKAHDAFEAGFSRLLQDLQAAAEST